MAVNMITQNKERVKNKSVLLFSGGMDSVIFDKLLKPDVLLYINSGADYERQEKNCLEQLIKNKFIDKKKLIILNNIVNLSQFERDDKIVPNRNAILMMIASLYGEISFKGHKINRIIGYFVNKDDHDGSDASVSVSTNLSL